jgi:hypothetical protein
VPLHADHSMVVKFDTRNAAGYRTAVDKLRQWSTAGASDASALNTVSISAQNDTGSSHPLNRAAILQLPDHVEDKVPLHADHSMVVKFDTRNAAGYRTGELEKSRVCANRRHKIPGAFPSSAFRVLL